MCDHNLWEQFWLTFFRGITSDSGNAVSPLVWIHCHSYCHNHWYWTNVDSAYQAETQRICAFSTVGIVDDSMRVLELCIMMSLRWGNSSSKWWKQLLQFIAQWNKLFMMKQNKCCGCRFFAEAGLIKWKTRCWNGIQTLCITQYSGSDAFWLFSGYCCNELCGLWQYRPPTLMAFSVFKLHSRQNRSNVCHSVWSCIFTTGELLMILAVALNRI